MEVKPGYKQTEVGVIPEDWKVNTVGDFVIKLEAGVSVNSQDKEVSPEEMAVLKTSCVAHGSFIPDECKCIATNDLRRAKITPRKDTIIFSRMNTPALVGECGYIDHDYPNLFLPDRLWMSRPNTQTPHNVRWLAFLLGFPTFNRVLSATVHSGIFRWRHVRNSGVTV
jgi:type I restriction enzyme S subunit